MASAARIEHPVPGSLPVTVIGDRMWISLDGDGPAILAEITDELRHREEGGEVRAVNRTFRFRVTVFEQPRGEWRDSYRHAMDDAINGGLASYDESRGEHYLSVPVAIQREEVKDAVDA